jgi:hypothetical protein
MAAASSALVLGDLAVGNAHQLAQPLVRHPGQPREHARKIDRGAPPELCERVVPDHRAGVVKALEAERLAKPRVILGVNAAAGQAHAVLADRRVAPWRAAPRPAVPAQWSRMDDAEAWRGEGDEHHRVSVTVSGTPLRPRRPAATAW